MFSFQGSQRVPRVCRSHHGFCCLLGDVPWSWTPTAAASAGTQKGLHLLCTQNGSSAHNPDVQNGNAQKKRNNVATAMNMLAPIQGILVVRNHEDTNETNVFKFQR